MKLGSLSHIRVTDYHLLLVRFVVVFCAHVDPARFLVVLAAALSLLVAAAPELFDVVGTSSNAL